MLALRTFLTQHGHSSAGGVRGVMAWSAHGSLRRWVTQSSCIWQPTSTVAKAVFEAGFRYDPVQDIIFSRIDAWQHRFGYCYAYDLLALPTGFVFDCEPVFFSYGDKDWMIELWKGQYGIETGCEVGVYNRHHDDNSKTLQFLDSTIGKRPHDDLHSRFYRCVDEPEFLQMAFTLYRNGVEVFSRGPERHWWLTGFKWGMYSRPEELTLKAAIRFPDADMESAFASAWRQMGHECSRAPDNTACFTFDRPRSFQPRSDWGSLQTTVVKSDASAVAAYQGLQLPSNDPNLILQETGDAISGMTQAWKNRYVRSIAHTVENAVEEIAHKLKEAFGL